MLIKLFQNMHRKIFFLFFVFVCTFSASSQMKMLSATNVSNQVETVIIPDTNSSSPADRIELNLNFYVGLGIDLVVIFLLIFCVYYPNYKKLDTVFTFILFNIVIFLLTFVLNKVQISMGAAFGLFAVFAMLRYRTAGIGMKDMTYLFIFIALGLICGIQLHWYQLIVITGIVFIVTLLMDTKLLFRKESSQELRYEKIENIKPEKRAELINDLSERTGLKIHRVSINEINFLRDTAMITCYYYD